MTTRDKFSQGISENGRLFIRALQDQKPGHGRGGHAARPETPSSAGGRGRSTRVKLEGLDIDPPRQCFVQDCRHGNQGRDVPRKPRGLETQVGRPVVADAKSSAAVAGDGPDSTYWCRGSKWLSGPDPRMLERVCNLIERRTPRAIREKTALPNLAVFRPIVKVPHDQTGAQGSDAIGWRSVRAVYRLAGHL